MSLIRSLSNPEGLYIVVTKEGVQILQFNGPLDRIVPPYIWYGFFERYHKLGFHRSRAGTWDFLTYRGFEGGCRFFGEDFRHYIKYKNWEIPMWGVTFEYIAENSIKK